MNPHVPFHKNYQQDDEKKQNGYGDANPNKNICV